MSGISLEHYLVPAAILFCISVAGHFINRKNMITLLMCIELMLLAVNINFIAFARYIDDPQGHMFVLFTLTVAAAETAIGLSILTALYREHGSIHVARFNAMKG